jgi:hypothetical protein
LIVQEQPWAMEIQAKSAFLARWLAKLRGTDLVATTRLEELWNEVINEHSVSLLCTYALQNADEHLPKGLVELHSRNLEAWAL